jgi:hypothetical protein
MKIREAPTDGRDGVAAMRRLMNDFIAKSAASLDREEAALLEFFCECGDSGCKGVVELTVAQYRCARFWSLVAHSTPHAA